MREDKYKISYHRMEAGQQDMVVDLVLNVFNEFVAPQYSNEGIAEFTKFVNSKEVDNRFNAGNIFILAKYGEKTVGVIEIRNNSHIALLFVEKTCQLQGVARELVRRAIIICLERDQTLKKITVNSSPNACDAYYSIGFKGERTVKTINGIQFVPMELDLEKHNVL